MKSIFLAIFTASITLAMSSVSAESMTVPCYDGGGSGGWMFPSSIPESWFPLRTIKVRELHRGSKEERMHPDFDPQYAKFTRYGYCTVAPTHSKPRR